MYWKYKPRQEIGLARKMKVRQATFFLQTYESAGEKLLDEMNWIVWNLRDRISGLANGKTVIFVHLNYFNHGFKKQKHA